MLGPMLGPMLVPMLGPRIGVTKEWEGAEASGGTWSNDEEEEEGEDWTEFGDAGSDKSGELKLWYPRSDTGEATEEPPLPSRCKGEKEGPSIVLAEVPEAASAAAAAAESAGPWFRVGLRCEELVRFRRCSCCSRESDGAAAPCCVNCGTRAACCCFCGLLATVV